MVADGPQRKALGLDIAAGGVGSWRVYWYDLTVTDPSRERRYAGHVENGAASISDPGMGALS